MNPLFSVLIANYNNGRFLQEAIDSVANQTYANWEIIIVDDKSTDNSFAIYEKYKKDRRFHIFFNRENKGCGYTKRLCVEFAHGELCGFLDPDDVLLPDALTKMVEAHGQNEEASLVLSRLYVCDEKLNVVRENRKLCIKEGEGYFTNGDYAQECFASFKKGFYAKTEGIASYLKKAVDQDLYFKLDEVGRCVVLDDFTYKFRLVDSGISHEDSGIPAAYWNMIVGYETCKRRGLDPMKYSFNGFREYCMHWYRSGENKTCRSTPYRLGKALLKPFSLFKK